jgi:protoheme IX farnesyltransferase
MTEKIKFFLLVAKPGIIFGNLITAAGGFLLASKGRIDITVLLATVTGISLVVASGCVLNNCLDRNLDRLMVRTCNRVLAKGLMSPKVAVLYASLLGIAGTALLWATTSILSLAVVLTGLAIYVGLYSLCLKRHSVHGTIIGSLAGAAPPLAGYCAVSNRFDLGALILLVMFSLWQIPHSYAIAIFFKDDFTAAAIPILPVKHGIPAAKKHIIVFIPAFTVAALMLTFEGYTGYGYFAVTAAAGLSWLYLALSGSKTSDDRQWAKKLFAFSVITIFALSVMMSIDFTVPAASDKLLTYFP